MSEEEEDFTIPEDDPPFAREHMESRLSRLVVTQELYVEYCRLVGERCWNLFRSLVQSGFTEDQALEIVKSWEVDDSGD